MKLEIVDCDLNLPQGKSRKLRQKQDGWISFPNSCISHQFNVKRYKYVFRMGYKVIVISKKARVSTTINRAN